MKTKLSPIYNVSNWLTQPRDCVCRRCGAKTQIAQRRGNEKWFTVDQTVPGEWVWHQCKPQQSV